MRSFAGRFLLENLACQPKMRLIQLEIAAFGHKSELVPVGAPRCRTGGALTFATLLCRTSRCSPH
jgi:hypothetical protein